jgi:hypothetical protein
MHKCPLTVSVSLILSLTIILIHIFGCSSDFADKPAQSEHSFPEHVTGIWQAYHSPWRIKIDPDGSVAWAVLPLGEVKLEPNKVNKVRMRDDSISTYTTSDFITEYNPSTRELFVTIDVREIHLVYQDQRIDGNSLNRFVGPVSPDGETWTADLFTLFDYGPRFPQDTNHPHMGTLLFQKVDDEPAQEETDTQPSG